MNTAGQVQRSGWSVGRLLFLVVVVALPLLAYQIFTIAELREARSEEIAQEVSQTLSLVRAEQQRIIEDIHHVLVAFTELQIGRMDAASCRETMARIKERYPNYLAINVSDRNHVIWCATTASVLGRAVPRSFREEALKTGQVVTGHTIHARTTDRPAIPFSLAYRGKDGSSAGVVTVLLDTGWLDQYLAHRPLPKNVSVLMADRAGTILARVPQLPELPHLVGQPLPERFMSLLRSSREGVVEMPGLNGVSRLLSYSPVGVGGTIFYLQVGIDKSAAMRPVDVAAARSLLVFTGLLLITGFGVAWGVRRFLRVREEALETARQAASVLASTADAVIEIDRDWRFTYLNEKARSLFAQGGELIDKCVWDVFPEMLDTPLWPQGRRAMAEQVPVDTEVRGQRSGRWFWMRVFPSRTGLAVYLLDITRRKQAEEDLRESKEHLSLALESARAGTFEWDLRTGQGQWSEESYRLFGLDPRQIPTTKGWLSMVHPDDVEAAVLDHREHHPTERRPYLRLEYRVRRPDGATLWVLSVGRVRYDAEGRPVQFSGLNFDITERKVMEQALQEAKAKAEEANMSKSRFLAAASHDLRQPLQSALLFAGVLHRHVSPGPGHDPLASLERALDTLKGLLDSLLDVSRLDAGMIEPHMEDFPLGPLLEEIAAAYAPVAVRKGLEFRVEPGCEGLSVRSDRLLLGRMIRNLVENAIRYTDRGSVRIACRPDPAGIRFEISDSGIGIPAAHQEKVFEEFHQVGNPERDRTQGLGLGLAIVRRLSVLLHHPIGLRSEPGLGSTFDVTIPRSKASIQPPPTPEPVAEAPGQGRLAVLIDDDAIVLTGLQALFQEWGYDVLVAASTEQALERLRARRRVPDLVIADYRLRGEDVGTDAIVKIRDEASEPVPGIILTGEIGAECERDAARHDLTIVHKPITPRQLHRAVERLLGAAGGTS